MKDMNVFETHNIRDCWIGIALAKTDNPDIIMVRTMVIGTENEVKNFCNQYPSDETKMYDTHPEMSAKDDEEF